MPEETPEKPQGRKLTRRDFLKDVVGVGAGWLAGKFLPPYLRETPKTTLQPKQELEVQERPTRYLSTEKGPMAEWIKNGEIKLEEPWTLEARPNSLKDNIRLGGGKDYEVYPARVHDLEKSNSTYKPEIDLSGKVLFQLGKVKGSGESGKFGIVKILWSDLMGGYNTATIETPYPPRPGPLGKLHTSSYRADIERGLEHLGLQRMPIKDSWKQYVEVVIFPVWDISKPEGSPDIESEASKYFYSKIEQLGQKQLPDNFLYVFTLPREDEPNLGIIVNRKLLLECGLSTPPPEGEVIPLDNFVSLRSTEQVFDLPLHQLEFMHA